MQAAAADAVLEGASYCAATARSYLHPGAIEFWLPVVPALAYWLLSGLYEVLDQLQLPATEACRLHSQAQADKKNVLTKGHVVGRVLIQHAIQCATSWAFTVLDPGMCERTRVPAGGGAGAWVRAGGTWLLGEWASLCCCDGSVRGAWCGQQSAQPGAGQVPAWPGGFASPHPATT